jgi:hypothetical protein
MVGLLRPGLLLSGGPAVTRPQDVFATSLYTGTEVARTITNGLDLSGQGGLVWTKGRSGFDHSLVDTLRGAGNQIYTNATVAEQSLPQGLTAFGNSGYSVGTHTSWNANGSNFVSWGFRRAPKFFDVVTYTGDGTSGRQIPHGLGVRPGLIIVKRRDAVAAWPVWHRANAYLGLNTADASASGTGYSGGSIDVGGNDTTSFVLFATNGNVSAVNAAGGSYVAYLFAHDPDTTNGIIQCGSFTDNTGVTVNLGWRPQFILAKGTGSGTTWVLLDTTRGWTAAASPALTANTTDAEINYGATLAPTNTGFTANGQLYGAGQGAVYLAIRAPT